MGYGVASGSPILIGAANWSSLLRSVTLPLPESLWRSLQVLMRVGRRGRIRFGPGHRCAQVCTTIGATVRRRAGMRAIFISYRRDDAEGHAGRLFEDLADRFGTASVFMDVTGIEPGRDFRKVIEQQVASCGVLLAVIGKSWLTAADAEGRRRLDDPHDFVLLETATALKRDIPVIPVLVHGARMPRAEQLPEALTDLAFRNSVELNHARWSSDVQLLITALLPYVDASSQPAVSARNGATSEAAGTVDTAPTRSSVVVPKDPEAPPRAGSAIRWPRFALGAAAVMVAAWLGFFIWQRMELADSKTKAANAAKAAAAAASISAAAASPSSSKPAVDGATVAVVAVQGAEVNTAVPKIEQVDTEKSRTAAASASAVVARAPAGRKIASSIPERADAVPVPRVKPDAKKPAVTNADSLAAERLTSDSLGATTLARATPERSPSLAPNPEVPPAERAPAAVREAERMPAVASMEPGRANAGTALLGDTASSSMTTRSIAIRPDTRYVNVTGGEVVRFTVGDRGFVWNFNGRPSSFDLALVAPPGMLDHKVTAYVAPNPLYPRPGR